jgi:ATP-binding cassette subfamily B protein/subfamily B ATP-binding cassette protein MsbA
MDIGETKNCIANDSARIVEFVQKQIVENTISVVTIIVNGVILLYLNYTLALISLLMVPLSFFITSLLSKKQREASEKYRMLYAKYESWLYRCLSCWKDIKTMVLGAMVVKEFNQYWNEIRSAFIQKMLVGFGNSTLHSFKDFFITKMNLYFIGGILILKGHFTIGLLITFINYYDVFFNAIQNVNNIRLEMQESIPSLQRVSQMLNITNENENKIGIENINKIEFKDICFGYDSSSNLLEKINFTVENNGYIAIVGESGCGKSTLFKLLLAVEHYDEGEILISGVPLTQISLDSLYEKISVVTQEITLFNMSILDNIVLNNTDVDMEKVVRLCKEVGIHDDIISLPEQYDTLIGEKGVLLSGGQKQKLAIVRAVLRDNDIIILDEPTSAMDGQSEEMVNALLKKISKEKIVISIAHRLSAVFSADRVLVIQNGRIVGDDTATNIVKNDIFMSLYNYKR